MINTFDTENKELANNFLYHLMTRSDDRKEIE